MTGTRHPPGPKGNWLTGNLPEFRRDMLAFFTRCAREYGDVVSLRLGPRSWVFLNHPDYIEQVLVTDNRHFAKHYVLQFLRPVLGNGLLTSEGDLWLRQRRLVQPAFQRQRIEAYGPAMVELTQRMLADWRHGETRDLHTEMMRLTMRIVARALLDVDVTDEAGDMGDVLNVLLADFSQRFGRAFPLPKWLPTSWNRRVKGARLRLDQILHDIIKQRRATGADRGDLLSTLMRARDEGDGSGMTDRQLRDEAMTLFLAGHETTANALSWTWYLLAQHPEVEAKLAAELGRVLGDRPPRAADLPQLVYAERVILESMRLYPPVYGFGRRALRDCVIGGYDVPANTTVFMSQWVTHHDPRFFDRPDEFKPDRWADDLARRLPKYAYFPFGGGPRVCIGNTFALIEAMLVLATVVPRFRFTLVPGHPVKPWPSVTLRPAHGIKAVLTRR